MKKKYNCKSWLKLMWSLPALVFYFIIFSIEPLFAVNQNQKVILSQNLPVSGTGTTFVFENTKISKITQTNFSTIKWGTVASQPYTISEAQGEVVNGKLYSFGGFDSQKSGFTPTNRAYVYDPTTNIWTLLAPMPPMNGTTHGGVTHAGFTTDGTDIYFAGGYTSNAGGTGQIFGTKEVWQYKIAENQYKRLPDLPITLAAGQLEFLNGKLHHISGTNAARTQDLGNHYVLDLNNLSAGWKILAPLPNPRQHAGSAVLGGKIYYIGGQTGHDSKLITQKDVHCYDPNLNTWTKIADLPVPDGAFGRGHISSSVIIADDRLLVLGGEIKHGTSTNMVSAYTPATNTWENLTPMPGNRYSGVAGWLEDQVYYTGGSNTKTTYRGIPGQLTVNTPDLLPLKGEALVKLFPNPSRGKEVQLVFKNLSKKEILEVKIFDALGKLLEVKKILTDGEGEANIKIKTNTLKNGLYLIKTLSQQGGDFTTKLIIDK